MVRIRDSGNRRAGCLITPCPTQTAISEKRLRNPRKTPTKSLNRTNTNQPTVTTQNPKCVFEHLGTEIRSRVFASGEFISTSTSSSRSRQKKTSEEVFCRNASTRLGIKDTKEDSSSRECRGRQCVQMVTQRKIHGTHAAPQTAPNSNSPLRRANSPPGALQI